MEEKSYKILDEGQQLVVQLKERYPKAMEFVEPKEVVVLAIEDAPPKSKDWDARTHIMKGAIKAILELAKYPVKFYIELYESEWKTWSNQYRQWLMFHELLHIPPPEASGLVKHDIEDFAVVLDKVGIEWQTAVALPDMLTGAPVQFSQRLLDRIHPKEEDAEKPEAADAKEGKAVALTE